MDELISRIIADKEPSIEYYGRKYLSGEKMTPDEEMLFQEKIKESALVRDLLSEVNEEGEIPTDPYRKWYGAHWILYSLAEINYPIGCDEIKGLTGQVYSWLLSPGFTGRLRDVKGLPRGHACILGNALYYLGKLAFPDERYKRLKDLLLKMRWDDGGWNCDRKPKARKSSLVTTCIAVRGLSWYRRATGDDSVDPALHSGIMYLLDHQLCKSRKGGEILHPDMVKFFYPEYYHYSILYALRVLVEAGFPYHQNMEFALDFIERSKQGFGWCANKKYYWKANKERAGRSLVNWGSTKLNEMNPFVTMHAIHVLQYYGTGRG